MTLKTMLSKDLSVNSTLAFGIIGFSIGLLSTLLIKFTSAGIIGLMIGSISYFIVPAFLSLLFCNGSASACSLEGINFLLMTPLLYLGIGLVAGRMVSKFRRQ